MKRINNIYQEIISIENLQLADSIARKGKAKQNGVIIHDKNKEANILRLHEILKNKEFKTSEYQTFKIYEPKERLVYKLPYFPDRIIHHAIMNQLESMFTKNLTKDTYSCIKGRGIHKAKEAVEKALKNKSETIFCLKFDITKFYPSVNHDILKDLLLRKIKDAYLIKLLFEIIDSAIGLPIGNYLSQSLANFYLSYFDHWIKETKRVKHYFRYADDIVILADNKESLHELLSHIKAYLALNLKLEVKDNYQIFPVSSRGIDFVGYKMFHTHTLLRKSIKKAFARILKRRNNKASIASYKGWLMHCNSKNLIRKLLPNENIQTIKHQIKELNRR